MTATISARILQHLAAGMTLPAAMDTVLGAGTYAALASDLYETLQRRAEG